MEHLCKVCNKTYSSYQSLWIHNKKYHKPNNPQKSSSRPQKSSSHPLDSSLNESENKKKLTCDICKNIFSRIDNLKRHQIKCDKNKFEKYDQELETLKNKVKELENKKTNTKSTTNIKVNGNLFNSGNKMDIGNKFVINKTGTENIDQITYNEVSTIFDNEISSVIKLIELVNFNENKPENHSFCSTALESPYLSFYNTDTNSVNKERKRYFFEEVICKSIQNHEILYSKFKNKFNSVKRKQIEDNISNLKKIKENTFSSKIMGEMIRNLNLLSYNNRDLIQDTWSGSNKKYDHDSDEEFMAMMLDDPTTQKIIAENKKKENKINSEESNNESESGTDDERPVLLLPYSRVKSKSKKNIVV